MRKSVDPELIREIAERVDDGRRVHMRNLSRELNVPVGELRAAYGELARQRGGNPLLDRARGYNAESRRIARR